MRWDEQPEEDRLSVHPCQACADCEGHEYEEEPTLHSPYQPLSRAARARHLTDLFFVFAAAVLDPVVRYRHRHHDGSDDDDGQVFGHVLLLLATDARYLRESLVALLLRCR